ncbi:hypothetical protein BZL30_1092 [Mycobacterium kansasii]|uniref:Uncharacterized protein n=1 Tax=Mycobacterium kansasii TaxID=1768 RepID=A0A1V3XRT3_MYCKA|nr:hypothetical protein BZL30_1092 [Mycobacterium kansasii]
MTEDDEPVCVHLVYSTPAYARRHATGEWAGMEPASLTLDEFIDGPLRGMHEGGDLLGPDFNADLAGLEIEPIEMARALLGSHKRVDVRRGCRSGCGRRPDHGHHGNLTAGAT